MRWIEFFLRTEAREPKLSKQMPELQISSNAVPLGIDDETNKL
jgi:hypothetical protein